MDAQQSSGLSAKVRDMWQRNQDLLRNAGSLAATTGLTSLFGFVFWIVAAKGFSRQAVGYGETTTNAMQLLGTVGMLGLGTMLIGELPKRPERERGGLFAASLAASGLGSLVLGLAFPVAAQAFHADFPEITGTLPRLLVFAAGVMLTASTLVFDEGTIGLMRGGVQLWRNLFMSGAKLLALPVTAMVLHDQFGVGISSSFVLGTAVSLIPAVIMLLRGGTQVFHRPDWGLLRRLAKVAINHNWLNLAIAVPPRLIPVLVTAAVGPSDSAVFYIAWMITSFLFMVPVHLGTVLFAIASASPELVAEKLRFVLRTSLLIGLPVMAVLGLGAHFILSLIGPGYAVGTIVLWTLVIGYIPQLPRAQYIAVSRATGKVGQAARLVCMFAGVECAAIFVGGRMGGLNTMAFAYLGVLIVEGIVYAPTVLRAAYASTATAIATGAFPAAAGQATAAQPAATGALRKMTGPLTRLTGSLTELPGAPGRQETGLATLFALAATAASNGHTLDVATEVWRTGSFPALRDSGSFKALRETGSFRALRPDDAPRARAARAATSFDLYGGRAAEVPVNQQSYRSRQLAGIDALLALATPEAQGDDASEQSG